jgi:hypothetical protein
MKKISNFIFVALFISLILTACAPAANSSTSSLDGKTLVDEKCSTCHSADAVMNEGMTQAEWSNVVLRMIGHGLKVTDVEQTTIVAYLAQTYP